MGGLAVVESPYINKSLAAVKKGESQKLAN